jgi:hypothetical protein
MVIGGGDVTPPRLRDDQRDVRASSGNETDNLIATFEATVAYSGACVNSTAGLMVTLSAAGCAGFQGPLTSRPFVSAATCSFTNGDCVCSETLLGQVPTAPQAYTISGSRIVYASGGTPMDYCVSGTTLTTRDAESHATFYNTAHKL